jgi:hypothetical protein
MLVFLEVLQKNSEINHQELSILLGKIVHKSKNLKLDSFSKIEIKNNNYFFGNFKDIIIIIDYTEFYDKFSEFLGEIYISFMDIFERELKHYSIEDIARFKPFTKVLRDMIKKYQFENNNEISLNILGKKEIIEPLERNDFPERLSVYKRDEVLWKEAELIKKFYATEFTNGLIFKLHIYLSITPKNCYKLFINFSDYPYEPEIIIDNKLKKLFGKNLEEILFFYKTWDRTKPPHVVEIIQELEKVLITYNYHNKLSETPELNQSDIPDLKPLPEINSLEKEELTKREE